MLVSSVLLPHTSTLVSYQQMECRNAILHWLTIYFALLSSFAAGPEQGKSTRQELTTTSTIYLGARQ